MVTLADIEDAFERIKGRANKTPVMTSTTINRVTGCSVYFKCENLQKVGAFKFRGALNNLMMLSEKEKRRGVIAHSSGNHAQAVSLASSMLGIKVTIVMPSTSPEVKVNATRGYGAEVVFCEPTLQARESTTSSLIGEHGYTLIHPYNNPPVIAGAGTAAYELIKDVGPLDYMFGPVGGGGLISGTAIATKGLCPESKVIAVEPENADDAYRSFKEKKFYPSVNPNTIADGLLTSLGEITFDIILKYVDDIVTVTESEIVQAMRILWERMKLVVEPSGAVSLAGVLKMQDSLSDQKVGVILSGGNVDLDSFFRGYEDRIIH
ncbi:MAG: threonine ammonia-lyase [Candidatus Thorarchaeota archaeon]|jgi:threonine dehydratase